MLLLIRTLSDERIQFMFKVKVRAMLLRIPLNVIILYMLSFAHRFASISLHEKMTTEELAFYFGDTTGKSLETLYELGTMRKINKPDNLLTRVLGNVDTREEYEFNAFGQSVSLKMERNQMLASKRANIVYIEADGHADRRNIKESQVNCHLLHREPGLVAAVSNCKERISC